MQKLFNADILDIFFTDDGLVYASKEILENGKEAISFIAYDFEIDRFRKIPVSEYIDFKFSGYDYNISKNLIDFVTCKIRRLSPTENIAIYGDGKLKFFDNDGNITKTSVIEYNGNEAGYSEITENEIWAPIPNGNTVVNYSLIHNRIEMRIGSKNEKAFSKPTDVSIYDGCLYVCNAASFKINTVGLNSYSVNEYAIFNEPVYRYFRNGQDEFVLLKSGLFVL